MQDTLLKAVGRARKGKSVDQLQDQLGWTKTQVRSAIRRATAKGLIEIVQPGLYRRVLGASLTGRAT
jgi:DNA-binding FadR family transcriptional regulator